MIFNVIYVYTSFNALIIAIGIVGRRFDYEI